MIQIKQLSQWIEDVLIQSINVTIIVRKVEPLEATVKVGVESKYITIQIS
jgi:hypothetical protein